MQQPIFRFPKILKNAMQHPCRECGGPTIEVVALERPCGPTGIYRCLQDDCGALTDPTFRREEWTC